MVERAGVEAKLGFPAHPHMLRHACGFALANKGHDTRALQAYLGHRKDALAEEAKQVAASRCPTNPMICLPVQTNPPAFVGRHRLPMREIDPGLL